MAIAAGASALGFVTKAVGPPATIDNTEIAEIIGQIPPWIGTVVLTASQDVEEIRELQRQTRANAIQLVDRLSATQHRALRLAIPGVTLIQVVHVTGEESFAEADAARDAHALLLDSGNLSLPTKQFGGTGRSHDWRLSRRIRERSPIPVILAGGLNAANVASAINEVRPYAVDVCSGVRGDGVLNSERLTAFADAVRAT